MIKSPKSIAFDVVAMVTKSIVFRRSGALYPPAITARVDDAPDADIHLSSVRSPKSNTVPVD